MGRQRMVTSVSIVCQKKVQEWSKKQTIKRTVMPEKKNSSERQKFFFNCAILKHTFLNKTKQKIKQPRTGTVP